jgi:hypothetical protein
MLAYLYWLVAAYISACSASAGHVYGPVLVVIGAAFAITGVACGALWYDMLTKSGALTELKLVWLLPTGVLACGGVVAVGTWPSSVTLQGLQIALIGFFGLVSICIVGTLARWFMLTRTAVAHAKRVSVPVHDHNAAVAPSDANKLAVLRHILDASVVCAACCAAVVTVLLLSRQTASSGIPTVSCSLSPTAQHSTVYLQSFFLLRYCRPGSSRSVLRLEVLCCCWSRCCCVPTRPGLGLVGLWHRQHLQGHRSPLHAHVVSLLIPNSVVFSRHSCVVRLLLGTSDSVVTSPAFVGLFVISRRKSVFREQFSRVRKCVMFHSIILPVLCVTL